MAVPSSQVLASWLKDWISQSQWLPISQALLESTSAKLPTWADDGIADLVDERLQHVVEHLRDELAIARLDGQVCPYELDEEEPPYIRLAAISDDQLLKKLKRICPFEFETVCAKLLEKLGGRIVEQPKTADGGVDFIVTGIDIFPKGINAPVNCRATVIGQAKRYRDKPINEKLLREFVGASLLKRHVLRTNESLSPLTPVILAFWTTANFDPNCKIFARSAGVWIMDGHTMATYLRFLGLADWVHSLRDVNPEELLETEK